MFNEVLRIKPVLDNASAKQMEQSLSKRFATIAGRFKGGLMAALKGSILGISLGLLNKLLNPIEAMEERIKSLLGQGQDIRDLADRFNTTPGQMMRLQDVGASLGVTPDQLKDMLTKFANTVETARKELADPFQQRSEGTQAVKNFVGEKDLAEAFFQFLQSLRAEGKSSGRDVFYGEHRTEKRRLTGAESRADFERAVFGEELHGGQRRLVDADFPKQLAKLNEPSAEKLTRAVNKNAALGDQDAILKTRNATRNFLGGTAQMNAKMIADMEKAQALENERENKRLASYEDIRKAADGIEEAKKVLMDIGAQLTKGVGYLGQLMGWLSTKVENSPWFRGIFGKGK